MTEHRGNLRVTFVAITVAIVAALVIAWNADVAFKRWHASLPKTKTAIDVVAGWIGGLALGYWFAAASDGRRQ